VTSGAPAAAPVGICVVDKPAGWTSHDVVARCRRLLGTRKVGHSGTLDPMATGVLVLGVGPATRLLTFLSGVDKDYDATIRFGVETDSLDADGEVVATHDTPVRADAVLAAAAAMRGESDQVPPMVSAVKVDGVRLHERARAGEEVERPSRRIRVERFDVTPTDDPLVWHAAVSCSSGTYVRVLAADLGHAVGSGAHLTALPRQGAGTHPVGVGGRWRRRSVGRAGPVGRPAGGLPVPPRRPSEARHGARPELASRLPCWSSVPNPSAPAPTRAAW
jgi:tRNA pseudouridine55 synthase